MHQSNFLPPGLRLDAAFAHHRLLATSLTLDIRIPLEKISQRRTGNVIDGVAFMRQHVPLRNQELDEIRVRHLVEPLAFVLAEGKPVFGEWGRAAGIPVLH